jgi:multidrug efflux pump subunit AcrB
MKNLIEWSVQRPALANILMVFLLGFGTYQAFHTQREILPEFSLDLIQSTVVYPGASAEEIEESICVKIEEEIAGLEGIKKITSTSREGMGTVVAELYEDADTRKVLDDVKNEIDQIDTFPADAEDPIVVEVTRKIPVINISVFGDVSEKSLVATAEQVRDDLLETPGISQVELIGARDHEILVETSESTLREYGLTLEQIAERIRSNVLDLPGGTLESESGKILVRTKGRLYTADEFRDLIIISQPDGTVRRLGEIARVSDTFEDEDVQPRMNGKRAIVVKVDKTPEEDALAIADQVRAYTASKNRSLPASIRLTTWADGSVPIRDRLELLTSNAVQGLALVFIILALFLRLRLAFWVALGIPISILGAFAFLGLTDFTLNMLTMFSFIVVLGVVVDDAIVIGENVFTHSSRGVPQRDAAVNGAAELAYPVINSIATTIVAFAPMLFVAGSMGKLMRIFPVAIIAVLLVSLFEAFMILPAHLAHMKSKEDMRSRWNPLAAAERGRSRFDAWLQSFIDKRFEPAIRAVASRRYIFSAAMVAMLVVSVGLVASGRLPFVLFPKMDSDTLSVKLVFPQGTPMETTLGAVKRLERAVAKLEERYPREDNANLVTNVFSIVGRPLFGTEQGSHVAEMLVELLPSQDRGIPSYELARTWRELTGDIPDALALTYSSELQGGPRPGGMPVEIQLLGPDLSVSRSAAAALQDHLRTFEGVYDVQDSYRPSKQEFRLSLKPGARQLGISLQELARQVRANLWGYEALIIQRGRDEVTVRVQYPERGRAEPGDLERMKIRTADGRELPFRQVASVDLHRGPATIDRIHRKRAVTVTADVDENKANAAQIVARIEQTYFDTLQREHPGVTILVEGQKKETAESVGSLRYGFIVAVLMIYVLLVNQFRTYTLPLVVMTAIPFSVIGVIVGHFLMGLDLTLLSLFGVLALAGIVVNDSLLLVHAATAAEEQGHSLDEALVAAGRSRFRQVILTSLSTIGGLTPILSEQSFQAQFLKPMTVSVVFGLIVATGLVLLFVPALMMIRRDILNVFTRERNT